jgi:hypothetical protein
VASIQKEAAKNRAVPSGGVRARIGGRTWIPPFGRHVDHAKHGARGANAPNDQLAERQTIHLLKIDMAGMIRGSFRKVMIKSGLWALEAVLRQIAFLSRQVLA